MHVGDFDPYTARPHPGVPAHRDPFRVIRPVQRKPSMARRPDPVRSIELAPSTPTLPHPRATRLARGVYLSPFLSRTGNDVWFAVDSRHRCIRSLEVTATRPEELCRRVLAMLLEQTDPVPQLRVV